MMGGRLSDETATELDKALDSDDFADTGEEVHRSRYDDISDRVDALEKKNPDNLGDRMVALERRFDESDSVYDSDQETVNNRLTALESKTETSPEPKSEPTKGAKKS
jgi:hypothetical protein